MIWVHDYQLTLAPALLRARIADARIGVFLNLPFPSAGVFCIPPWRREILAGRLGADVVGLHTLGDVRHFSTSLVRVAGMAAHLNTVHVGDREVTIGAFPIGVDAAAIADRADQTDLRAEMDAIRGDADRRQIVLGVDRLDDTNGIPRRLHAIDRVVAREPHLRDRVRCIQAAVPSRSEVDSHEKFKRPIEESVGRIDGRCGTLRCMPVHYVYRTVPQRQLVALDRAADGMLVTPLRDGINRVAKEFVASCVDDDGVVILSAPAGASAELDGAVIADDVDAVADRVSQALSMPVAERRGGMQALRRRVLEGDVHARAAGSKQPLECDRGAGSLRRVLRPRGSLVTALREARRTLPLRLLLDYDGTLVPLASSPEDAAPDHELRTLLSELSAQPTTEVEIVSGRPRGTLHAWLGDLPISLCAEHGFWFRRRGGAEWRASARISTDWMSRVRRILEQFVAATPGARIEIKSVSVAWHYRGASPEIGAHQAHDLRMVLVDALRNQPLEVLEGKAVIEVRPRGVSKAAAAGRLGKGGARPEAIVAIGDDRTDEELFRALPSSSITVAVGDQPTCARFRLENVRAVREVLRSLLVDTSAPNSGRATGAN